MSIKKSNKLSPAEEGERSARQNAYEPKSDELNPKFLFQGTHTGLLIRCAGGDFDLVQMAKDELANRGLDLNGQWVGFKTEKKARNVCPGCDGKGKLISGRSLWKVYECGDCAGIFSSNISMTEMRKYVLTNEWADESSIKDTENVRYFDFKFRDVNREVCRIHGYFHAESKKVVQLG